MYKQKDNLLKLIKKNEINTIELNNNEYEQFRKNLYSQLRIQDKSNKNESDEEESDEDESDEEKSNEEESDEEESDEEESDGEESDIEFDKIYPKVDKAHGKGKTRHILIMPDDFKKIVMRIPTKKGDQVRSYYVELEKLIKDYMNYQVQFLSRREELLEIELKESRADRKKAEADRKKDREERKRAESELKEVIHDLEENVDDLHDKLDIATDDRVPKTIRSNLLERFVIMKLNDNDPTTHDYYVIRAQKRYMARAIRKLREDYPNAERRLTIDYQPNSKNLFNRIKEKMHRVIDVTGNYISPYNITHTNFINRIKSLNLEKKSVDE
jgi:hypothetical protein